MQNKTIFAMKQNHWARETAPQESLTNSKAKIVGIGLKAANLTFVKTLVNH